MDDPSHTHVEDKDETSGQCTGGSVFAGTELGGGEKRGGEGGGGCTITWEVAKLERGRHYTGDGVFPSMCSTSCG